MKTIGFYILPVPFFNQLNVKISAQKLVGPTPDGFIAT